MSLTKPNHPYFDDGSKRNYACSYDSTINHDKQYILPNTQVPYLSKNTEEDANRGKNNTLFKDREPQKPLSYPAAHAYKANKWESPPLPHPTPVSHHPIRVVVQWNPVNLTTFRPRRIGRIINVNEVVVLKGFFK